MRRKSGPAELSREFSEAIQAVCSSIARKKMYLDKDRNSSTKNRQRLCRNSKGESFVMTVFVCSYRGFYSRKYEHDFYARKKYLHHVENKNEEVRKNLDDYHKLGAQNE